MKNKTLVTGVRLASFGDVWPEARWKTVARDAADALKAGRHLPAPKRGTVAKDVAGWRDRVAFRHVVAGSGKVNGAVLTELLARRRG